MEKRKTTIMIFAVILVIVLLFIDTNKIDRSEKYSEFIKKPTAFFDAVFYKSGLSNDTYNLTLEITAKVDKADIKVNLILPEEAELIAGDKEWKGPVEKGKRQDIVLQVKIQPGKRSLVEASVTAEYMGKQSHSSFGLWLGEDLGKESSPKTDSKGRPIKEYKGNKKEG